MIENQNLVTEYKKLGFALASLHSSFTAKDITQIDYDVCYFGYCFAMAKIKKQLFSNDKALAMSL